MTINGGAAASATNRIFNFTPTLATKTISLNSLTLANGNITGSAVGGAINATTAILAFNGITFSNNRADGGVGTGGGAVSVGSTNVSVTNCAFTGNAVTGANAVAGAFINTAAGTTTFTNSTFTNNSATAAGGAISTNSVAALNIAGCTFTGNISTSSYGGAINASGLAASTSTIVISDSTFIGNFAGAGGGAVRTPSTAGTSTTINNSLISGNSGNNGGAFYTSGTGVTTITINESALINNVGITGGGAINLNGKAAVYTLNNSTLSGNVARGTGGGGAIRMQYTSTFTGSINLNNCTITANTASGSGSKGGGIFFNNTGGNLNLSSTIVAGNTNAINRDIGAIAARTIAGSNNLLGAIDQATYTLTGSNAPGNVGTEATPVSAGLTPLAYFGGSTPTHALKAGSLALNAGFNGTSTSAVYDQRKDAVNFPRTDAISNTTDIGAVESPNGVGNIVPYVTTLSAPTVTTAGGTTYTVTVTYTDENAINFATIGTGNVTLTGPGTATTPLTLTSATSSPAGTTVTATYTFTPPVNGAAGWDVTDNGTYTLKLLGNQVTDADGTPHTVYAQTLGTVTVAIPNSYLVDNSGDADDGNISAGNLTLREAIRLTNTNNVGVADKITFASGIGASITLGSELLISDPVSIVGPGAGSLNIKTTSAVRLFNFSIPMVGTESTISGLTLSGGSVTGSGAAILENTANLTINNCIITGNSASTAGGAINLTAATLRINDSTLSLNTAGGTTSGGAIATSSAFANIQISRSTISGNTAGGSGGGLYSAGGAIVVITDSTIVGNKTTINTSASGGGGASFSTGTVSIINSTISGNSVTGAGSSTIPLIGGGIRAGGTNLSLINSTVAFNVVSSTLSTLSGGGGIGLSTQATSTLNLQSSLVAKNSNSNNPDVTTLYTTTGTTVTGGDNLVGQYIGSLLTFAGANQVGTSASPVDPLLAPISNYGGSTATVGLLAGSPALNQGSNPNGLSFDQRGTGFPRVVGAKADIGSFEGVVTAPTYTATLANVTTAGGTTYTATVVYTSSFGINVASIDVNDVRLTGPGFGPAAPASVTTSGTGTTVTATYLFAAPGGTWSAAANGLYTLSVQASQVFDSPNATSAGAGTAGTFTVAIAATFVVDENSDVNDGNFTAGKLSLREAVARSNASANTLDTITFSSTLYGQTITLGGTSLSITDPVIIQGPGAGVIAISGNKASRIFDFNISGAGAATTISGITITRGAVTGDGGAILGNDDTVVLNNVTLSLNTASNRGGAVYAATSLTVNDSDINFNSAVTGGGLQTFSGTIQVNRSVLTGNSASNSGGGLYISSGTLSVANSTLTANTTFNSGADLNGGAAISINTGNATITNSTISGNSAFSIGSAIRFFRSLTSGGTLTINNSTITANTSSTGGAIGAVNGGSNTIVFNITMNSTIVAQNVTANSSANFEDLISTSYINISGTNNLIGNAHVNGFGDASFDDSVNNQYGTTGAELDAKLLPLANFGGPLRTHAPGAGSPAIDMGNNTTGLSNDQRGSLFPRTSGAATDVGSVEGTTANPYATAVLPTVLTQNGTTYTVVVTYRDETGVNTATIDTNDITITGSNYAGQVSPTSVTFTGSGTTVVATYVFPAPGGTWDASDNGVYMVTSAQNQVYDLDGTPNAVLPGTLGSFRSLVPTTYTVDNIDDTDDGNFGAGQLTLREAVRLSNTADVDTTDIIAFSPAISGQTIVLNTVLSITNPLIVSGSGIANTIISGNNNTGIFSFNYYATFRGPSTISGVTLTRGAATTGAGIQANRESLTLSNVLITACTATGGAAVNWGTATITAIDSSFTNNLATTIRGGAFLTGSGSLSLLRCTVSGNTATSGSGGGIYQAANGGYLTITDSTISGNSAGGNGGGIASGTFNTTITNSTISGNTGTIGGAFRAFGSSTSKINLINSTVTANSATTSGGGGGFALGGFGFSGNTAPIFTAQSSIVAQNLNDTNPDFSSANGMPQVLFGSRNLIGALTDVNTPLAVPLANIAGTGASPVSALLAPLANNGGPTLRTRSWRPARPSTTARTSSCSRTISAAAATPGSRGPASMSARTNPPSAPPRRRSAA